MSLCPRHLRTARSAGPSPSSASSLPAWTPHSGASHRYDLLVPAHSGPRDLDAQTRCNLVPVLVLSTVAALLAGTVARGGTWPGRSHVANTMHHWSSATALRGQDQVELVATGGCMDGDLLSDFSSHEAMVRAGWQFSWDEPWTYRPSKALYAVGVPNDSYWGFRSIGQGVITLWLHGSGQLTLDFGNSWEVRDWAAHSGDVLALLDDTLIGRAHSRSLSVLVQAPFRDGTVLRLIQQVGSVLVINGVGITCTESGALPSTSTTKEAIADSESVIVVPPTASATTNTTVQTTSTSPSTTPSSSSSSSSSATTTATATSTTTSTSESSTSSTSTSRKPLDRTSTIQKQQTNTSTGSSTLVAATKAIPTTTATVAVHTTIKTTGSTSTIPTLRMPTPGVGPVLPTLPSLAIAYPLNVVVVGSPGPVVAWPKSEASSTTTSTETLGGQQYCTPPCDANAAAVSSLPGIHVVTVETRNDNVSFPVPGVPGAQFLNLGAGHKWRGFLTKVRLYHDHAARIAAVSPEEVLIYADGGDVAYGGCSHEELLARYRHLANASGGAEVICGADSAIWPMHTSWHNWGPEIKDPWRYKNFQQRMVSVLEGLGITGLNDNPYMPYMWRGPPRYVNSGFVMGPARALLRVLDCMLQFGGEGHAFDDQLALAECMFRFPRDIAIDYGGGLVLTLQGFNKDVAFGHQGAIVNRVTCSPQCFIHFNAFNHTVALQWLHRWLKEGVPDQDSTSSTTTSTSTNSTSGNSTSVNSTAEQEVPPCDNYRYDRWAGRWGGSCRCPGSGQLYQVGDRNNYCRSLACDGGTPAGPCGPQPYGWPGSGMKVTCR